MVGKRGIMCFCLQFTAFEHHRGIIFFSTFAVPAAVEKLRRFSSNSNSFCLFRRPKGCRFFFSRFLLTEDVGEGNMPRQRVFIKINLICNFMGAVEHGCQENVYAMTIFGAGRVAVLACYDINLMLCSRKE